MTMTATDDDFDRLRDGLLNDCLLWSGLVAIPGVALSIARVVVIGWQPIMLQHLVLLGALWLLWLKRARLAYAIRIYGLLGIYWLAAIGALTQLGPVGVAGLLSVQFAFLAVLFLDARQAIWLIAGNTLSLILIGIAASLHWLEFTLDYRLYAHHPLVWAAFVWNLTAYPVIVVLIGKRMLDALRRRERQARVARRRLADTLESTPNVAVQWYDAAGRILYWNRASTLMYGWSAAEAVGKTLDQLIYDSQQTARFCDALAGIAATGQPIGPEEYSVRHRDGSMRRIVATIFAIPGEPDPNPIFVCVDLDVTARTHAEQALIAARQAAEAASSAKSAFLAHMSHELRTPLNAVIGFGQMLDLDALGPLTASQREAIGHILAGGRHLLELINEVLDLARIESGRPDLTIESVPLAPLVATAIDLSRPAADARRVEIRPGDAAPDLELTLHADAIRVRQVLLNLLSNAIKYNHEGGRVTVETCVENERARVTVRDTGRGIPAACQADVFQSFERLGAERTGVEGTGIGLAICRRLIEAMGGRIGFASQERIGSAFWFELPLTPVTPDPPPAARSSPRAAIADGSVSGQVLYVEDSPTNVLVMRHMLRVWPGVELQVAPDGATALDLLATWRPDLILLDIGLPDMSGLELLRAIREDTRLAAIPAVAASASALPDEVQAGLAAGFAAYLTKPLDAALLLERIRPFLAARPPASAGEGGA